MKKNISISLLTLFLFHSIGHFLLIGTTLCLWKKQVKNEFLGQKTDSELVLISKNDAIKVLDGGEEIERNGERFDVVKTTTDAYLCWHDAKETHLIKNLFQSFISKESKKSDADFSILKNIFKIYFIDNHYFTFVKIFFIKIKSIPIVALLGTYFHVFFIPPK